MNTAQVQQILTNARKNCFEYAEILKNMSDLADDNTCSEIEFCFLLVKICNTDQKFKVISSNYDKYLTRKEKEIL